MRDDLGPVDCCSLGNHLERASVLDGVNRHFRVGDGLGFVFGQQLGLDGVGNRHHRLFACLDGSNVKRQFRIGGSAKPASLVSGNLWRHRVPADSRPSAWQG